MSQETNIEWTHATWNPWHGCRKVSPGCKYCYMFRDKGRFGLDPRGAVRAQSTFHDPLKWKTPKLIFTCSWSDFFIDEADPWRHRAWEIIRRSPQHTFQILTKRPERIAQCLPDDWGRGYPNVWLGVSVETTRQAHRINPLLSIPAHVRFISFEPLIGRVDPPSNLHKIDWAIIGGESGNNNGPHKYRPCKIKWIRQIATDCTLNNVPVFIKQLGTYLAAQHGHTTRHGQNVNEFPADLQLRQMPRIIGQNPKPQQQ